MAEIINEIIAGVQQQAGLGGWAAVVGSLGVVVTMAVRAFRMWKPDVWDRLHPLVKLALPFLAAALGSLALGIAGALAAKVALGSVIGKLIIAALGAGVAAISGHHVTKAAGQTMDMAMVAKDPDYQPGTLRKIGSLAVDLPNIDKAKDKALG